MATTKPMDLSGDVCRVALISRIDFGSDGFRQALLELAKHHVRVEDAHMIVFSGGLVSYRSIKKKVRAHNARLRDIKRELHGLEAKEESGEDKQPRKDQRQSARKIEALLEEQAEILEKIEALGAEKLADELEKRIPHFENSKGQLVKIYFSASEAYDGELGIEVSQILARKREDIRVYKPNMDEMFIRQTGQTLEIISPAGDRMLMRTSYSSTHADRTAADAENLRQGAPPDVQIIGGHGVNVSRPLGESPQPYFTVPVLHKPEAVRGAENQIGIRFLTLTKNVIDPIMRTYPYNDYVMNERQNIVAPQNASAAAKKVIEALKKDGSLAFGRLEEATGMTRLQVERVCQTLIRTSSRVRKTWPGLVIYQDSHRVDFHHDWIQRVLRYKPLVGQVVTERMALAGCWHGGSSDTDYEFLEEETSRVILAIGATMFANCGDLIEGLKHGLERKGALLPGLNNNDKMEELVGAMHAAIAMRVFAVRFAEGWKELLKKSGPNPSAKETTDLVAACLIYLVFIAGNHDDWGRLDGQTPLVLMKRVIKERLIEGIERELAKVGATMHNLSAFVDGRVIEPRLGRLVLPTGLRMSMLHPGMPRAQTTSARLEQALRKERRWGRKGKPGSHIVVIANFHTAAHVETRAGEIGQRVGVQIGTGKHRTGFEDTKMKIVDMGIAHLRVDSIDGRVVMSEVAFYGNEPNDKIVDNPYEYTIALLKRHRITPTL